MKISPAFYVGEEKLTSMLLERIKKKTISGDFMHQNILLWWRRWEKLI